MSMSYVTLLMLFSYIFLSIKLRKLFQHSSKSEHKDVFLIIMILHSNMYMYMYKVKQCIFSSFFGK